MEPVALVFNEDNYYLISYNEKHEATTNYRVDRIDSVRILDDPVSETARSLRRKVARYTEEAFKMFNGPQEAVTLRFADKLIGPVLDKFGEDTKMTRVDDHSIEATVQVRIAPTFWGWLTQFAGDMTIPVKLATSGNPKVKNRHVFFRGRRYTFRKSTYIIRTFS